MTIPPKGLLARKLEFPFFGLIGLRYLKRRKHWWQPEENKAIVVKGLLWFWEDQKSNAIRGAIGPLIKW